MKQGDEGCHLYGDYRPEHQTLQESNNRFLVNIQPDGTYSVGFAIRIENRYKGIRSTHKVKMAVFGCTRECAEAQSKDVGLIATEHGYNLYVRGNGGTQPRHAELLATDIDEETAIRYIDRFFVYTSCQRKS